MRNDELKPKATSSYSSFRIPHSSFLILSILVNCLRRSLTLARVFALRASVERQAEPEFPEDCERDEGGDDRDELRLRHLEHDDVHVAAEAERERDERRD